MPLTSPHPVFCPAGQWTQVEWYTGIIFLSKLYDSGGVFVRWRYFSAGFPFYWEGSYTGSACITLPAGPYTSLEFNPSADTSITPIAGC